MSKSITTPTPTQQKKQKQNDTENSRLSNMNKSKSSRFESDKLSLDTNGNCFVALVTYVATHFVLYLHVTVAVG